MQKVLFVNLTKYCNVDCPRCYLTPLNRSTRTFLEPNILHTLMSHEFFRTDENPVVIFQGGEPGLVGKNLFSEYVDAVRSANPYAKMTMVSNLYVMPDWLMELSKTAFEGKIETTWAYGMKMSLNGDENLYQRRFTETLKNVVESGIYCTINVELNRETYNAGPRKIIQLLESTGAHSIEFDISVRFNDFRQSPLFAEGFYPQLPLTISYREFSFYIKRLREHIKAFGLSDNISCGLLSDISIRRKNPAFNTLRERDFLTVNPDGTMTTNPLFSDIRETYIGNIYKNSLDYVLSNENRQQRIEYEQKRLIPCKSCEYFDFCSGGPSHVPVYDGSGECAGMKSTVIV